MYSRIFSYDRGKIQFDEVKHSLSRNRYFSSIEKIWWKTLQLVQNSFHDLAVNRPLPRRFEQNRSRSGVHHPENGAGGRRDKGGIGEREERWDDRRPAKTNERWVARYRIIFVDSCGKLAKWWIDLQSGGWVGRSVMCEIFERHAKRDLALDRACTTLGTHVAPTIYDLPSPSLSLSVIFLYLPA